MKRDSYIQRVLWIYGVRIFPLIAKEYEEDTFEYLHSILKEKDKKRVITNVRSELDKVSLKTKGAKKKSEEEDLIKEIHGDFKKALYKDKEWGDGFLKISASYKEIYKSSAKIILEILEGYLKDRVSNSLFEKSLQSIKEIFRLSDKEGEILTFFFLLESDSLVEKYFKNNKEMDEMVKSIRLYCRIFKLPPKRLKSLVSK